MPPWKTDADCCIDQNTIGFIFHTCDVLLPPLFHLNIYFTKSQTSAVRSRISSKLILASCVGYFDRAYNGPHQEFCSYLLYQPTTAAVLHMLDILHFANRLNLYCKILKNEEPSAVRSRISSKFIFAGCVECVDRAYYRFMFPHQEC